MKAQLCLTVSESKRLIGKAVKEHESVKRALKKGILAIAIGSTNAYVAEEILGRKIEKQRYVAGFVDEHGMCVVPAQERIAAFILENGKPISEKIDDVALRMKRGDVFIKGANALDYEGIAGVMMASETGGTIAKVLGVLKARGAKILIPVGLEKLIPFSVNEISNLAGIYDTDYSTGIPVGVMPVAGEVITELEAFKILAGVDAYVLGSGGLGGGEGSKTFLVEGRSKNVKKAIAIVNLLHGEPRLQPMRSSCAKCHYAHCPQNRRKKE